MLTQRRYAIWGTTYLPWRTFLIQVWMKLTSWHVFGEDNFWFLHELLSLNYLFYFLLFGVDLNNDLCCVQLIERPRVLACWTIILTSSTSHCRKRSFARYRSNGHNEHRKNNYDLFDNIDDFWISFQFFHQCIKLLLIESIKSVFCFTYDVKILTVQFNDSCNQQIYPICLKLRLSDPCERIAVLDRPACLLS